MDELCPSGVEFLRWLSRENRLLFRIDILEDGLNEMDDWSWKRYQNLQFLRIATGESVLTVGDR
jgi:hypothetical protein